MNRTLSVRTATAIAIGVAVLGLSGCGKVVDSDSAAKSVSDTVAENLGFTPTDVKCPSGVDAKAGGEFDCTYTAPDGNYKVHLKITKVDGDTVNYDIESPEKV